MSKLYAPLGSEFSCPDTEMIPLKTTENRPPSLEPRLAIHLGNRFYYAPS